MFSGIHFLLSYACNYECDHCFLYCRPGAKGTFTLSQIREILVEAVKTGSIESIYFEGGEPFLFYPLMVAGIKLSREMGFTAGVVTNAYWATSLEDAELWLKPLRELGLSNISISDDSFHYGDEKDTPAKAAIAAAKKLNMPVDSICIDKPKLKTDADSESEKGAPVIGGGALFKGRAVEKLIEGLPRRNWQELSECPHEELVNPGRVHLDSYGNVQLCQGLSLGNLWQTPLSVLVREYNPETHPVCRLLIKGGPALLAKEYDVEHEDEYVDECHFCYLVRRALIDRFPQYLAPGQVYGLE